MLSITNSQKLVHKLDNMYKVFCKPVHRTKACGYSFIETAYLVSGKVGKP